MRYLLNKALLGLSRHARHKLAEISAPLAATLVARGASVPPWRSLELAEALVTRAAEQAAAKVRRRARPYLPTPLELHAAFLVS